MKHRDEEAASTRPRIVGAALAVAAVIAVPVVLFAVLGGGDDAAEETEPSPTSSTTATTPSTSESATATPTPTETDDTDTLESLADLPKGPAPKIAWAEGPTLHLSDGTTGTLPDGAREFALMGTGTIVSDGETVRYYSSDGAAGPRSYDIEGGLATSPQRKVVGWAGPDGSVTVVQSAGAERYDLPAITAEGPYDAAAITSEDCLEGRTTDAGCTVFVNTVGKSPQVWASTSHGFAERFNEDLQRLTARTDGVDAGITSVADDGSTCSAVQRETESSPLWETCDLRLMAFSPDGGRLFAVGSIGDGIGDGEFAVLDAGDGTPSAHVVGDGKTFITDYAWEDARHVLMVAWSGGEWSVVRMAADGTLENAVAPRKGADTEQPFLLRR